MRFFQDPPRTPDLYDVDDALQAELQRRLPREVQGEVEGRLRELSRKVAEELAPLGDRAEAEPPVHVPYDAWGRRVDEIRVSPAWDAMKAFSAREGIVATGYERELGAHTRVMQAAMLYLYAGSSATFSCPLAMTDAAARVLEEQATGSLRERLFPRLTTRDPERFITSGQWMTERAGGSDVGNTETVARPLGQQGGEDRYALHGVKWFTSATTSEMALTLARIDDGNGKSTEGSRGLTMFCVEVEREPGGGLKGIQVNRLKDKLGTRALPTAELTLEGVPATRIGEVGRGVPNIATMLNITRWYNAVCSASGMALATFKAADYATRRPAFGRLIGEHPLHRRTLDAMAAETAAALALCMELSALLGRAETEGLSEAEGARLRGLIPLSKLSLGKQAVQVASEALECFGGAGYVEDTGLPRLLRDAQVLPIWEGTTNVLSLDVLRAEAKDRALSAVVDDLAGRAETLAHLDAGALDGLRATIGRAQKRLQSGAALQAQDEARALALTCAFAAQAVYMGETAATLQGAAHQAAAQRFSLFTRARFLPPLG